VLEYCAFKEGCDVLLVKLVVIESKKGLGLFEV